jgi:hypothetical protein
VTGLTLMGIVASAWTSHLRIAWFPEQDTVRPANGPLPHRLSRSQPQPQISTHYAQHFRSLYPTPNYADQVSRVQLSTMHTGLDVWLPVFGLTCSPVCRAPIQHCRTRKQSGTRYPLVDAKKFKPLRTAQLASFNFSALGISYLAPSSSRYRMSF